MLTFEEVIGRKENQLVINYLDAENRAPNLKFIMDKEEIEHQKSRLEVHPEVLKSLWVDFINQIPIQCHAILLGRAVLINPRTGIVFAIAEGTFPLLLRVSQNAIDALLQSGGKIILSDMDGIYADARKVGSSWIYCFSFIEGLEDYVLDAYNYSYGNQSSL